MPQLFDPLPARLGVGRGTAVFLHGSCEETARPGRSLDVVRDGEEVIAEAQVAGREWWAIAPLRPVSEPTTLTLSLRGGDRPEATLGTIEAEPGVPGLGTAAPLGHSWPDDAAERVAICMGTYEPPLELFERQISSIREQSHRGWVCVISDDGSSEAKLSGIKRVLGDDDRFLLNENPSRRGFYANFERALSLAPADSTHIALCDQDDRWYPERLETLLAALGDKEALVYSDMRIVDTGGEVISDTYWRFRRNNWTDLGTLLIGNTVTGAASLFRRSILEPALPFPPPVGRAFHDHWLASVSLASGPLRYVDRPLHDYVQHPGVVIGFASANADRATGPRSRAASRRALRLAGRALRP
ncbi:MAG: glycosyltransferase, partial [Solirubrobacterales bacterium]|nr:glycosyltransferase [Solirubrobacterales bacterium]